MAIKVAEKSKAPAAPPPAQAAAVTRIPFQRAARMKSNLSFQLNPITLGATSPAFGPIQITANGYMRALWLEFAVASSGNSATVALNADSPFNLIQQMSFTTSSGDSLIVPMDGYALAMVQKYGAFGAETPYSDPRTDPTFANFTTGSGATAGTGTFALRIPFEIDASSGFCSLPNMAANRSYNLQGLFNPLATIFATPPNGTVTVTVSAIAEYWSVPNDTNAQGQPQETAPPGNGSFHVLQIENIPINAGAGIYQLHNVGNVIRQIIPILRTSAAGTPRETWANTPAVLELVLNNDLLFYNTRNNFRRVLAQTGYGAAYGAVGAAVDTPQGQDNGVFPYVQFLAPGSTVIRHDGPRNQYLPTLDATLLQIRGTSWASAGTLQVVTSSVVPTDAAAIYAPHLW